MSTTRVRSYLRKRGFVRSHLRRTEGHLRPFDVRILTPKRHSRQITSLFSQGVSPRSISAFVDADEPHVIYISYPRADNGPEDIERIIHHENLHSVLFDIGEGRASVMLDARRDPGSWSGEMKTADKIEPSGLFVYHPRKKVR